jgi:L-amino acid N-acyltransferase YncA
MQRPGLSGALFISDSPTQRNQQTGKGRGSIVARRSSLVMRSRRSMPSPLQHPNVVVRHAQAHDLAVITRIYEHAVRYGTASFEIEPPDELEVARRFEDLRKGGYPYLVAEHDGALAGFAYAGPYRSRPAYRWSVEDSIYIAPQAQRRGIGRALLERLMTEARGGGFRQMIAVIGDSANTASIELHRALGFRLVGTFDNIGFKFGRWLDSVLMQRALGEGATTPPVP